MNIKQFFVVCCSIFSLFISTANQATEPSNSIAYISGKDNAGNLLVAIVDATSHKYLGNVECNLSSHNGQLYLAFSPDKKKLYILHAGYGVSNQILVIDTNSNKQIAEVSGLPSTGAWARSFAISPNGKKGYVTYGTPREYADNVVYVFNTDTNQVTGSIEGINPKIQPSAVVFSADGQKAFVVSQGNESRMLLGEIVAVDTHSDRVYSKINLTPSLIGIPGRVALSSNKLYIGYLLNRSETGSIAVDLNSKGSHRLNIPGELSVAISPDNAKAYILGQKPDFNFVLNVVDTSNDNIINTINMPVTNGPIAVRPDNKVAYVGVSNASNSILIYDLANFQQIGLVDNLKLSVMSIVFLC